MTTATSESPDQSVSRWLPTRKSLLRILRDAKLRALVGGQIIAAIVIWTRSDGWWQRPELLVYDTLRTAWEQPAPRDRLVLIGQTDPEVIKRLYHHPLTD